MIKFRSLGALQYQEKTKPHSIHGDVGEDHEKLQKTVTPPWTFSFPKINVCKYAFNLRRNFCFSLPTIT
jgi:hypothetical protein